MKRNDGKITGHMIVKNEDQWIWFAIMSVIDYVDKMIIFDTGSIDKTVNVIMTFLEKNEYKNKIIFEKVGNISNKNFSQLRQKQLDMTETEYIMVVDGDEIWWREGMEEIKHILENEHPFLINAKMIYPTTDVFHYRDYKRERYQYGDEIGSMSTRIFSLNIDKLNCNGDYGVEGYLAGKQPVHSIYKAVNMTHFYFHCSKLQRSSALLGDEQIAYRRNKIFDDWDYVFPEDFKYPEVFYLERPCCVPDPFDNKDNLIKKIAKKMIRIYRFIFKRKDYIMVKDRDNQGQQLL